LVVIGSRFVESEIAFDAIHLSMIQGMAKTLPSLSIILETPLLLLLASIEGVPRST
jgi:thymidylate kinase